jgi:hypothetical protein
MDDKVKNGEMGRECGTNGRNAYNILEYSHMMGGKRTPTD